MQLFINTAQTLSQFSATSAAYYNNLKVLNQFLWQQGFVITVRCTAQIVC